MKFEDVTFTWPDTLPGEADNAYARGQRVRLPDKPAGNALAFLGAATVVPGQTAPSSGTGTVTYADGTTQGFTLTLSDWTLKGGNAQLSTQNEAVATMPRRNGPSGSTTAKKT